ncbi:unnamed protein product [Leptosia nina]|uniref:Uncharacterized protein n=1 Tax=Leptosia nina TaxID=320188 RepID=A0AAV1J7A5_9NEOP
MQKNDVCMSIELPYKLYKADAGGFKFKLLPKKELHEHDCQPAFHLISKDCPHNSLYEIKLDFENRRLYITTGEGVATNFALPNELMGSEEKDMWLSYYNEDILLGMGNKTFFVYPRNITGGNSADQFIGYIKFETNYGFEWIVREAPQVYNTPSVSIAINETENLHWLALDQDQNLPKNALIGGFENTPLYIARAMYSGSLCPGKYVPEEKKAYVPWGGRSHEKSNFQILCGHNADWILCKDDNIPENAFIAGTSEIHNEPLYIGRSFVDYNLIVGKVHMLYTSCYLPFNGDEVQVNEYEILVDLSVKPKGIPCRGKCKVNLTCKDISCI